MLVKRETTRCTLAQERCCTTLAWHIHCILRHAHVVCIFVCRRQQKGKGRKGLWWPGLLTIARMTLSMMTSMGTETWHSMLPSIHYWASNWGYQLYTRQNCLETCICTCITPHLTGSALIMEDIIPGQRNSMTILLESSTIPKPCV